MNVPSDSASVALTTQAPSDHVRLEQIVEQHILQRTWHRIHQLEVEIADGRLSVRGCAASYYAKQLAFEAILEMLDATEWLPVELDIRVGTSGPRSAQGYDRRSLGLLKEGSTHRPVIM